MLEQEVPKTVEKVEVVKKSLEEAELKINDNEKVYLMTWSPDPNQGPDADFQSQHDYYYGKVLSYLECCSAGAFCVESTQMGNPHYHGWYQISRERELGRITMVKVLQELGIVKIDTAKKIKKGKWYERGNALFYYKKDSLDISLELENTPIFTDSERIILDEKDLNWDHLFFTPSLAKQRNRAPRRMDTQQAEYKRLRAFYDVKYKANMRML